jgi:putative transposase
LARIAIESVKQGDALMFRISDNLWNEIKKAFTDQKTKVGRPPNDPRTVLSGVFYIMITGAQWHQLPDYYGRPTTVLGCEP